MKYYDMIEKIYIFGRNGGNSIAIQNVNTLYASGPYVLYNAQISGIRNLYVNGSHALDGAIISTGLSISDGDSDSSIYNRRMNMNSSVSNQVIMEISGNNTEIYHLICRVGDVCLIYCQSKTGTPVVV